MAVPLTCSTDELDNWDLLKSVRDRVNIKSFCVFRAHGGTGALWITSNDDVYGCCTDNCDLSLFGVTKDDRVDLSNEPFKVCALSQKQIETISTGVMVGGALDVSGQVYWWGKTSTEESIAFPPQIAKAPFEVVPRFVQVSCGLGFMAALTDDGEVYIWGQLISSVFECEKLSVDTPIESMACGATHVALLTKNGYAYTWGSGFDGQRGYSAYSVKDLYIPKKIELFDPCCSVACGPVSTLFLLSSGEIRACGANDEEFGYLGLKEKTKKIKTPSTLSFERNAIQVMVSWHSTKPLAIYTMYTTDNKICSWGEQLTLTPEKKYGKLIEAFYNRPTPKELGMVLVHHSGPMVPNDCSSIEVLSNAPESPLTTRNLSFVSSNMSDANLKKDSGEWEQLTTTSDILEFSSSLFGKSTLSDLIFVFDKMTFPGHRLYLCSRSLHFREILDLEVPALKSPTMDCTSYNFTAFKALLQYLYRNTCTLDSLSDLLDLHALALEFKEPNLAELTINDIYGHLHPDNVRSVIDRAWAIPSKALVDKCELYVTNLSAVDPSTMAKLFMKLTIPDN